MTGKFNSILQATVAGATIDNFDGSQISLTGGGTNLISQIATAGDTTITNSNSANLEPAPSRRMAPQIRSFRRQPTARRSPTSMAH